ncbi:hypothetical protein, partial [Brevibacillus sp. LEMMJ03]|uniref:hypothetical protein n=1 Tax=Brevibacillus sp. LEMMJ03 TaxID=2595056 RepID=UPI001C8F7B90
IQTNLLPIMGKIQVQIMGNFHLQLTPDFFGDFVVWRQQLHCPATKHDVQVGDFLYLNLIPFTVFPPHLYRGMLRS